MNRSGLKRVVKSTRGRKGSVLRSYWVKAQTGAKKTIRQAKRFGKDHSALLATGAALGTGALLAYKHRGSFTHDNYLAKRSEASKGWTKFRKQTGAKLGEHLVNAAGTALVGFAANQIGKFAGNRVKRVAGKRAGQATKFVVRETLDYLGSDYADRQFAKAGKIAAQRIRGTKPRTRKS